MLKLHCFSIYCFKTLYKLNNIDDLGQYSSVTTDRDTRRISTNATTYSDRCTIKKENNHTKDKKRKFVLSNLILVN